jgi:hypothetical protein
MCVQPAVFPCMANGRMTASRSSRKWGWGSGIGGIGGGDGGDGGDGAACHAYALHGPSQRSMGAFLQRLLCNGHGGCVKPGLVCGLESTAQASEHLNKDGRGTRGRSEQRVWPSCAGGVAELCRRRSCSGERCDCRFDTRRRRASRAMLLATRTDRWSQKKTPLLGVDSRRGFLHRGGNGYRRVSACRSCAFQPHVKVKPCCEHDFLIIHRNEEHL